MMNGTTISAMADSKLSDSSALKTERNLNAFYVIEKYGDTETIPRH
jgi:hypothetical protein